MQDETRWGEKRLQREFVRKLEALGLPVPWELRSRRKRKVPGRARHQPKPWYLWWEGEKYFRLGYIVLMQQVPYARVYRWAMARPHLLRRHGNFWYARLVDPPVPGTVCPPVPRSIAQNGNVYYSISELARRRGIQSDSARWWARRRPHLTVRVGKHVYCRDEEWHGRRRMALSIESGGRTYWSVPELADQLGMAEFSIYRWARLHPEETKEVGAHIYVCGEKHERYKKTERWIELDGQRFYSSRELARRRGVSDQAAVNWAKRHPELMIRRGRFIYVRDEPYIHTGPRRKLPLRPPEAVLKSMAARRARP